MAKKTKGATHEKEIKAQALRNGSKRLALWETPERLSVLRYMARNGQTMEAIAKKCGIVRQTLARWIKESQK
jgi:transposase-like protein